MTSQQESTQIVEYVNLALSQKDRTGICEILREIAQATKSSGAILWELDPDIPIDNPDARLFTAGHWFRTKKRFAAHDLLVKESITGAAILSDQAEITNNVLEDPKCSHSDAALEFYKKHDIAKFEAAPVHFVDGPVGALIIFRSANEPDFTEGDKPVLEKLCLLLPGLHDFLHHKVSLRLIDKVKNILQDAPNGISGPKGVWYDVCRAVRDCFHLVEASIFLEDPVRSPGEFHVQATTCEKYVSEKKSYHAGENRKTSWVVTTKKPLRIWDLRSRNVEKEKALIEKTYPNLAWDDSINIEKMTASVLDIPAKAIPPLSFMAQPICSGDKICGVLRCCTSIESPYYFTYREMAVLAVIASQIGQFWSRSLDRRTVGEENAAWSKLVTNISKLNDSAYSELLQPIPDVLKIFNNGLAATADMVPGGEIMDIRLLDPATDELYFPECTWGDGWTDEKKQMRFPASKKPPESAGSKVFQTGITEQFKLQDQPRYKAIFTNANSLVIAPIRSASKTYGVIDIRSTGLTQFPMYAEQMAGLLGQQLGLYHHLVDTVESLRNTVQNLRRTEQELKKQTTMSEQAFADWQHQIRGPIHHSYLRLREMIREQEVLTGHESVPRSLKVQSGLLRKAKMASQSLRLFLDLVQGQLPNVIPGLRIESAELIKLLREACLDNRILSSERRNVNFDVKTDSFRILDTRVLRAAPRLVEQAFNNVIDNAFKYSYRESVIEVSGSNAGAFFCLSVANRGLTFSAEDVARHLGERAWRAEEAEAVVGDGTGIGLWVVYHIMKAHEGRLEVQPTTGDHRTDVRLLFPWSK